MSTYVSLIKFISTDYQQTRGFKTQRLKTVGMGGQKSESELNKVCILIICNKKKSGYIHLCN